MQNKFFDPSSPSMRKGRDGEKNRGKKRKRLMIIVATTLLPAVDRPSADRWDAPRSCQYSSAQRIVYDHPWETHSMEDDLHGL